VTRAAAALGAVAALAGCLQPPPDGDANDAAAIGVDAAAKLDPGLVLWYRMDAVPVGGRVIDELGAHDADCDPCPSLVEGIDGASFDFDDGAYLSVHDDAALHTPEGSVAMWAWFDSTALGALVARPIPPDYFDELVAFLDMGSIWFATSGDATALDSGVEPIAGTWTHLVFIWSEQRNAIYVDGTLAAVEVSPTPVEYVSVELLIGADRDAGAIAYTFDGRLDDLRIYDRALDDDEIALLADR
jgi:hypothetical protein